MDGCCRRINGNVVLWYVQHIVPIIIWFIIVWIVWFIIIFIIQFIIK
ncbi:MAG: hypothetical protein J6K83_04680 [Bacteroidaceae bacterium]|nr:hypothetical protein [Bacteroidaceae bacterium]